MVGNGSFNCIGYGFTTDNFAHFGSSGSPVFNAEGEWISVFVGMAVDNKLMISIPFTEQLPE